MGAISAAIPRIRRIFAILEPTMFPIAIPGEPSIEASMLVTSSGIEVPKPTSVMPISSGDMPSRSAVAAAPRTSISPPAISSTRPPAMRK